MREIKFRYVYALDEDGGYEFWIYKLWEIQDGANNIEEIPFAINQYTGLKDKNDKEIYEGDVLNFGDKMEVCFGFNNGEHEGWYLKRIADGYEYTMHAFTTQFEVIGNIYENPELASPPKDN